MSIKSIHVPMSRRFVTADLRNEAMISVNFTEKKVTGNLPDGLYWVGYPSDSEYAIAEIFGLGFEAYLIPSGQGRLSEYGETVSFWEFENGTGTRLGHFPNSISNTSETSFEDMQKLADDHYREFMNGTI